jgi:dienelactone hydrolase
MSGRPSYSIDMSEEEEKKIFLDVKAAVDTLAGETAVDAQRIGLIGATAGTDHALRAASGDGRIQTMVLLTSAAAPEGEARDLLVKAGKPILAVASTEDINYNRGSLAEETRKTYQLSTNRESELILFEDAGRGSEMFKSKPELQRMVLRWFVDKLKPAAATGAGAAVAGSR